MCEICNDYKEQARAQARRVEDLEGRLSAAKVTLAEYRGFLADHSASHVYREPDPNPPTFGGWDS